MARSRKVAPFGSLFKASMKRNKVRPSAPGQRRPRIVDEKYLAALRRCPCLICKTIPSEAAHIRMGDLDRGKNFTGIGRRPDDSWSVPLCTSHHSFGADAQHNRGEKQWWDEHGIDPIAVAIELYAARRSTELMRAICLRIIP